MSSTLTSHTILQQEAESRLSTFDFHLAWLLGQSLQQRASEQKLPVAIEVYAFGQPLFFAALPGSSPDNLEWMKRKRNSVLRFGHASMYLGLNNEQSGKRMEEMNWIAQDEFTDHGGSFPLLNEAGVVFGAVSVSGLPSEEDHTLALWGIQQIQHTLNT
jgi:uncharacterized protein (UPF0303 family)